MFKKYATLLLGSIFSYTAEAGSMGMPPPMPMVEVHPWSVTASLGYTSFDYAAEGEGQTPLGRLAIGKSLCDFGQSSLGLEMGVQNGKTMDLFIPQATLDSLGGLPVTATVTALLDLLATAKINFSVNNPAFLDIKAGVAYRRLNVVGRSTIGNKSQVAGELQAGVGVPITESSALSLLYQGVYGGSLGFTADAAAGTGEISNIPVQNGILLSLNVLLNG